MGYENHIKEFTALVNEYCEWVEKTEDKESDIFYLQVVLSKLYCWAIQLPDCEPSELLYSDDAVTYNYDEIRAYFKSFPFQYYSTVFNAELVPSEEPVTGDIIDDLSDIYKDLKEGMWYLEHGSKVDAVFHWRSSFGFHWARHIMGAMYALYCNE